MSEGQVELGMDEVVKRAKSGLKKTQELERVLSEQEKEDLRVSNMLDREERMMRERDIKMRYRAERKAGMDPTLARFVARGNLPPVPPSAQPKGPATLSDAELHELSVRAEKVTEFREGLAQSKFAGGKPTRRNTISEFQSSSLGQGIAEQQSLRELLARTQFAGGAPPPTIFNKIKEKADQAADSLRSIAPAAVAVTAALTAVGGAVGSSKSIQKEGIDRMVDVEKTATRGARKLGIGKDYLRRLAAESPEARAAIESVTNSVTKLGGFMGGNQAVLAFEAARRGDIPWAVATEWASTGQGARAGREVRTSYTDPMSKAITKGQEAEFYKYTQAIKYSTDKKIRDTAEFDATMYAKDLNSPIAASIPGIKQLAGIAYELDPRTKNRLDGLNPQQPQGVEVQARGSYGVRQPGFDVTSRTGNAPINIIIPTGVDPRSGNRHGDR